MNYICTWMCADEIGEESAFPQTGKLSSSLSHQKFTGDASLFFIAPVKRFNKQEKHLLFTNLKSLPQLDGKNISDILKDLDVTVIHTDFKYKTPKGYFGSFQNQFYEFSILEYIAETYTDNKDQFLIVDSDCVFIKPANDLFAAAAPTGFISFEDEVKPDYCINGLSRNDLKSIYEDLLQTPINEIPSYHLGEFLLCSLENIKKIFHDFKELWPQLIQRHKQGLPRFNEEAHTLSYLYFKNGFRAASSNTFMRRIWTNPLFYREVRPSDVNLTLWHLPAEKTFGIVRLYDLFFNQSKNYGLDINAQDFIEMVKKELSVPQLTMNSKIKYYTKSYMRAIKKRLKKKLAA